MAPLFGALDRLEHQNWPLTRVIEVLWRTGGTFGYRRAPAHAALLRWTVEALQRYVEARAREQEAAQALGLPPTAPVRLGWVVRTERMPEPDALGARQYEYTVWGRSYASSDGSVRDLWVPSLGRAAEDRPDAEKAAIAYVLANGGPARWRRYGDPPPEAPLRADPPPGRVRVFGFGCVDGSVVPLLDWGREEVQRQFETHAAAALRRAAAGTATRPGESCVECKVISRCNALRRVPNLWGGTPTTPARKRRSISAWDLRLHSECPAAYHLIRHLHLNDLREEDEHTRRGRAVDAWLNERHRTRVPRGCRELPGPATLDSWSAGGHQLDGALARQAAAMLHQHRALCPLDGLGLDEQVLLHHRVTAYVPELDVVVLAVPDLLHTRSGGWIWRETKTSRSRLWEGEPLMRRYPQLALGVTLLAHGVMGADPRRSWVELELLHESDATLERLDPSHPEVIAQAREVIASLAQPLLDDTTYEPTPGRHCHGCQAQAWCSPGTAYVGDHPFTPGAAPTNKGIVHA